VYCFLSLVCDIPWGILGILIGAALSSEVYPPSSGIVCSKSAFGAEGVLTADGTAMVEIIEKFIPLSVPQEENCPILLAQLPNRLRYHRFLYQVADPEYTWAMVRPVLEMVASGGGHFNRTKFLAFPEAAIPFRYKDEIVRLIDGRFPANAVVILGFEHIPFREYRQLLSEYRVFNEEAYELVIKDGTADEGERPVNCCLIAIKDEIGKLHCYLEAKTHPFFGEEFLDQPHDLYRGRHLYLFRSSLVPLNFMVLICLDYIYRDRHDSNAITIIRKANQLFYKERQQLDLLFVVSCNPKPEHKVFLDTITGFYGEHLMFTPGVKYGATLFLNSSGETLIEGVSSGTFGHSSLVLHRDRRLPQTAVAEYSTNELSCGPVSQLRFGRETRLYFLELSLFHSRDPRTTRTPVKILGVFCWEEGNWRRLEGEEIISGIRASHELEP
jgi:hypothetical protein